jgi:hypothetical protein
MNMTFFGGSASKTCLSQHMNKSNAPAACAAAAKKTREISGSGLSNDIATCDVLLPKVGTAAVAASTGAADDFNHALARFMTPPYT